MIKKDKKPEELGSWMDTYGDMVTLLLCFFVLLYSMSSVDQSKWKLLVQSFNPSALEESDQVVLDAKVTEGEGDLTGGIPDESGGATDFDELYLVLKQIVEERNMQDSVEISRGDGFTFISFRDKVFFDGDSSVLRQEGKDVLDQFAAAMLQANNSIKEVQVLGHTSQGNPARPNNIRNDRMLSAQRSAEVIIYLQSKNAVSPEKLVGLSFGQFRPIAQFDTEDGRAKNRRVEILITKNDTVEKSLEEYYNQVYHNNQEQTGN
ncbi:OmpA/MotB family protein [Lacrimispora indolis]|uniref:OmpA/MotB family protein n=1 Tax=Lacrimispora indolis TaxID=69825 RepID=UPI000420BD84|nr:flagellar motor protein MotB [[Clostridium] methoxybenzovorans]